MAKHRYVWRLERNDKGAFQSGLMYDAKYNGSNYDKHDCDPVLPPGPYDAREAGTELYKAFNTASSHHYYFGFLTLAQYKRWCKSKYFRKDLREKGGILKKYKVPSQDIVRGNWQCAFKKDNAEWVASRSPAYC